MENFHVLPLCNISTLYHFIFGTQLSTACIGRYNSFQGQNFVDSGCDFLKIRKS